MGNIISKDQVRVWFGVGKLTFSPKLILDTFSHVFGFTLQKNSELILS